MQSAVRTSSANLFAGEISNFAAIGASSLNNDKTANEKIKARRVNVKTREFCFPANDQHAVFWHLAPPHQIEAQIGNRFFDWRVKRSEAAVIPSGLDSEWHGEGGAIGDVLQMQISPRFVRQTIENACLPPLDLWNEPNIAASCDRAKQIALMLLDEETSITPFGALYRDSLGIALLVCLLEKKVAEGNCKISELFASSAPISPGLPKYKLRRVTEYICEHLSEDIALEDLAVQCGVSVFYFARLFKNSTGQSPLQYILGERIKRGKSLLAADRLSITEIALEVGCSSQSHFSTLFRRVTGQTPKEYRARRIALC